MHPLCIRRETNLCAHPCPHSVRCPSPSTCLESNTGSHCWLRTRRVLALRWRHAWHSAHPPCECTKSGALHAWACLSHHSFARWPKKMITRNYILAAAARCRTGSAGVALGALPLALAPVTGPEFSPFPAAPARHSCEKSALWAPMPCCTSMWSRPPPRQAMQVGTLWPRVGGTV